MTNEDEPKSYQLNLIEKAERSLKKLNKQTASRILNKLVELAENVELVDHFALTGRWKGLYRIRIGDYRAIYELDHYDRQ